MVICSHDIFHKIKVGQKASRGKANIEAEVGAMDLGLLRPLPVEKLQSVPPL